VPTGSVANVNGALPSIIMVEVLGYGGDGGSDTPQQPRDDSRKRQDERRGQIDGGLRPDSPVHLLGNGNLTEKEKESSRLMRRTIWTM
jgi:hypothetical protein